MGKENAKFTNINRLSQNLSINFIEIRNKRLRWLTNNRICLEHTGVDTLML